MWKFENKSIIPGRAAKSSGLTDNWSKAPYSQRIAHNYSSVINNTIWHTFTKHVIRARYCALLHALIKTKIKIVMFKGRPLKGFGVYTFPGYPKIYPYFKFKITILNNINHSALPLLNYAPNFKQRPPWKSNMKLTHNSNNTHYSPYWFYMKNFFSNLIWKSSLAKIVRFHLSNGMSGNSFYSSCWRTYRQLVFKFLL